jgi:transcriptional regulator GlxA family with amidase domain
MKRTVAFVVSDGFNELDTFANLHIVGRVGRVAGGETAPLDVALVSAAEQVRTMYGLALSGCRPLEAARSADAVILGSGGTLSAVDDIAFMARLQLDPARQLIGAQCSGALILARLGLLHDQAACTDTTYRAAVEAAGVRVLDQPFHARGNIATAGGCLAAPYLAMWILWRLFGRHIATQTLSSVAPVGEPEYVNHVVAVVERSGGVE